MAIIDKIVSLTGRTNTGEVFEVPLRELMGVPVVNIEDGQLIMAKEKRLVASGVKQKSNGQLVFDNYKTGESFTGTPSGIIGFDSDGNIITLPISNGNSKGTTTDFSFTLEGEPDTIPIYNSNGTDLTNSDIKKFGENYIVNPGTKKPFHLWHVQDGSINIGQRSSKDGYRINDRLVVSVSTITKEITIGDVVYNTSNIQRINTEAINFPVKSEGGLPIAKLKPVFAYSGVSDATNGYVSVKAASNLLDTTSDKVLGVMHTEILDTEVGYVTQKGYIKNIDTSMYLAGAQLWLGPNGTIVSTRPLSPAHEVSIGYCVKSDAEKGIIFVDVLNGFEIGELHDVSIISAALNDALIYDNITKLWKNKSMNDVAWLLDGNLNTTEKTFGTKLGSDFDVPIIRNGVEQFRVKDTGVKIATISNATVSTGKFLVSDAGLVKYRTPGEVLLDIGGFATPVGLTTNYIPKWNGTTLVDSIISNSGVNVGIGTASPIGVFGTTIDIYGATASSLTLRNGTDTGYIYNALGYFSIGTGTSMDINIETSSISRIRILANGNVGIGTITPAFKLDIIGGLRASGASVFDGNLSITSGASVGSVLKCIDTVGTVQWGAPLSSERYKGEYDASSGIAPSGSPIEGDYYRVNTSGTYSGTSYVAGDDIYYDGTTWQKRANYLSLPIASSSILGGVKVGTTMEIDASGILNQKSGLVTAGTYTSVVVDTYGRVTSGSIPTTLGGYYISDAFTKTESDARFVALAGAYSNPSWITSLDWDKITGKPTTFTPSAHTLGSHSDTLFTSVSNGNIIKFDSTSGKWVNGVEYSYTHPTYTDNTLYTSTTSTYIEYIAGVGMDSTGHVIDVLGGVLPNASATQVGVLSAFDWNKFNNKQNQLTFGDITGSDFAITGGTGAVIGGGVGLSLATITQGAGSIFGKFTLDTKGRVIGNTAVVKGDLTSLLGTTQYLPYNTGTTNYVTKWSNTTGGLVNSQIFDNGTSVGIGTSTPQSIFHIKQANGNLINEVNHAINTNSYLFTYSDAGGGNTFGGKFGYYLDSAGNPRLSFFTLHGGVETQVVSIPTSNNYVGIGTINPTNKLHVVGEIRQTSVLSNLLKTDSNGVLVAAVANTDYVNPSYTGFDSRYYTETEVNNLFSTFNPTLTTNRIGIGVAGVLGSSTGLTWESNRYINITEGGNGTAWGIVGVNAFIQAINGDLRLEAGISTSYSNTIQSISVHNFNKGIKLGGNWGTTGQVLTSGGTGGVNTWTTITSGATQNLDSVLSVGNVGVNKNIILNDTSGSSYNLIGQRNGVQKYSIGWENFLSRLWLNSEGMIDLYSASSQLRIGHLSGSGLQMLTINNDGYVGKQAIPSGGGGGSQSLQDVINVNNTVTSNSIIMSNSTDIRLYDSFGGFSGQIVGYNTGLFLRSTTGTVYIEGKTGIGGGISGSTTPDVVIGSISNTGNILLNGVPFNFWHGNAAGPFTPTPGAKCVLNWDDSKNRWDMQKLNTIAKTEEGGIIRTYLYL